MATIDKVRIIVVGDSGVGKTCLTHLLAYNEICKSPTWTVGAGVEVKLHEYKEGTPNQSSYFVELFDIGGSLSHQNARGVFYTPTNGIILCHDLTNSKSQESLKSWLMEILNKESGKDTFKNGNSEFDIDPEMFLGSCQIPLLVVATKADLVDENTRNKLSDKFSSLVNADEITINCHDPKSLSAGSSNAVKLARFFDRVVERKYFTRDSSGIYEKRHFSISSSTPFTSPLTSPLTSFAAYTSPQSFMSSLNE